MSDLATALFGAMNRGGAAVGTIQADERHRLAEELKMQMQHDLAMLRQKDDQGFRKGMQDSSQTFQAGQQFNLFEQQGKLQDDSQIFTGAENEKNRSVTTGEGEANREAQAERDRLNRESSQKIASERNEAWKEVAGIKADTKDSTSLNASIETERKIVGDLVKSKKWKPGEPMPQYYVDLINESRLAGGRNPITQEQQKDDGFWSKFWGLISSGSDETAPPVAPADALYPGHGGQKADSVAAGTAADGSWKNTPTAKAALNKPPSTAPVQSTDSTSRLENGTSVSPAGVDVSIPQANTNLFESSSYTQGPSDASKQAALAEVTDLAKRVGNDYKKVWEYLSEGAKKAWGSYKVFADWFNKNTIGMAVQSQKQAYNETFRK